MTPSIKSLYPYALAEGEGVGTAYEYFVKRRLMRGLLERTPLGGTVLVAGLPEKYGTSFDFVLAALERNARVLVVDERSTAIDRARGALEHLLRSEKPPAIEYRVLSRVTDVETLPEHDLVLSCEVLQRLTAAERGVYARAIRACAPRGIVFVPNGENESHTKISGLAGLTKSELVEAMGHDGVNAGFTDMPPFPPGITRSADQRTRASTGLAETVAMWGLQAYALAEPHAPNALKRRVAHIVYATWGA